MKRIIKKLNLFMLFTFIFAIGFNLASTNANQVYAKSNSQKNIVAKSDDKIINDFTGVANYIHQYGKLPSNYITKAQASKVKWKPGKDLWAYAPGKSIGGDIFTNQEHCLPDAPGRVWHECDINYNGGHRGTDRILYSNDGLIYGTQDHYQTFTCYYGSIK